jgi:hypothetical protein
MTPWELPLKLPFSMVTFYCDCDCGCVLWLSTKFRELLTGLLSEAQIRTLKKW